MNYIDRLIVFPAARYLGLKSNITLKSIFFRKLDKNIPGFPIFVDSFRENGYLSMVTEYIDGQSLREIVDLKGKSPLSVSLNIILQMGNALRYTHQLEPCPVLHSDVNPSNVILRGDGTAILIDFGLVKVDRRQQTAAAARAITPGFSVVEQYGSGLTDIRSDVYSFGATLFYLLSGEIPRRYV